MMQIIYCNLNGQVEIITLKYIIDPNKHRFKTVVRILGLVYRFIAKLKEKQWNKTKGDIDNVNTNTSLTSFTQAILSQHEIQRSENYFYQKATEEIKEFSKPSKYERYRQKKIKYFITWDEFCQIRMSNIQVIQQTSWLTYTGHYSLFQLYIKIHPLLIVSSATYTGTIK